MSGPYLAHSPAAVSAAGPPIQAVAGRVRTAAGQLRADGSGGPPKTARALAALVHTWGSGLRAAAVTVAGTGAAVGAAGMRYGEQERDGAQAFGGRR